MNLSNFCAAPARRAGLLVTLLAAAAASSSQASAPRLELQSCRLNGYPTEVQCGTLKRPLNPAQPQGQQIELRVAVVPALARNKLPDPIVFLAGGPGQAAVELLPMLTSRLSRLNQRRDLVFVDQRGTGKSAPLECADERRLPVREQLDTEAVFRQMEVCREALQKLPYGDMRFFTTTIAMQDLDAVRQALGVAQWNVIGGSYGTRAGLEYLRQFPQATRRAVLDGLAPPDGVLPRSMSLDVQTALDTLLTSCSTEPGCEAAFPKLQAQWQQLLASLPREVTVRHPLSGKPETVRLEASHVINAVRGPLYVPALRSALPAAISQAAQGSFDALVGLSSAMSSGRGMRLAGGMHFSVVCAEDMPRMAQSQEQGRETQAMTQVYERICKTWPRGEVPPAFYEMPKAQSAVLLLSGGADPVTPPRHGERVQKALGAKAKHEVVPAAGHGVMGLPCMRDTLARFIEAKTDEEALAVKTDCAAKMPLPLAFVPPNPELPALPKKEAEVKK